nr:hypothetical protein [uncultured Allomuricauda sp.]
MLHRIIVFIDGMVSLAQWTWILLVGFFTAQFNYIDDMHKIIMTIVSMSLGAACAFFVKRWLNRYFNNKK